MTDSEYILLDENDCQIKSNMSTAGSAVSGSVYVTGAGGGGGSGWTTYSNPSNPVTYPISPVITTTTGIGGTFTVGSTGGYHGGAGSIYTVGPTGPINYVPPKSTSIQVGPKFKITAPTDGNNGPVEIECNGQTLDVGELISMISVFKILLKTVATDKEFCEKHPEIRDMAHAYLLEELKR